MTQIGKKTQFGSFSLSIMFWGNFTAKLLGDSDEMMTPFGTTSTVASYCCTCTLSVARDQ